MSCVMVLDCFGTAEKIPFFQWNSPKKWNSEIRTCVLGILHHFDSPTFTCFFHFMSLQHQ